MRTVGKIKINNQTNGYLIHGQVFNLQFSFPNVRWGLVFYRPGSMSANFHTARKYRPGSNILSSTIRAALFFRIIKGEGQINLTSNAYYPHVQFYLFSSLFNIVPTKLHIPLKINFFNTRECDIDSDISIYTNVPLANPIFLSEPKLGHSINLKLTPPTLRTSQIKLTNLNIKTPILKPIHHH